MLHQELRKGARNFTVLFITISPRWLKVLV
jgi:hypothetical protein